MTTGNGSNKPKTLWNGKKKYKEERKYRLDLQGYNNTESRFAFQKETFVLAEVHLKEETLPKDEVAKNGGAISLRCIIGSLGQRERWHIHNLGGFLCLSRDRGQDSR